jgi:hypothetical protein
MGPRAIGTFLAAATAIVIAAIASPALADDSQPVTPTSTAPAPQSTYSPNDTYWGQ